MKEIDRGPSVNMTMERGEDDKSRTQVKTTDQICLILALHKVLGSVLWCFNCNLTNTPTC